MREASRSKTRAFIMHWENSTLRQTRNRRRWVESNFAHLDCGCSGRAVDEGQFPKAAAFTDGAHVLVIDKNLQDKWSWHVWFDWGVGARPIETEEGRLVIYTVEIIIMCQEFVVNYQKHWFWGGAWLWWVVSNTPRETNGTLTSTNNWYKFWIYELSYSHNVKVPSRAGKWTEKPIFSLEEQTPKEADFVNQMNPCLRGAPKTRPKATDSIFGYWQISSIISLRADRWSVGGFFISG